MSQLGMIGNWLPDRPREPVVDNWPPKSLSIYADIDYEPRVRAESEYPEPNTPDDIPGDAGVPEEPNTEVKNDPVPEDEEEPHG